MRPTTEAMPHCLRHRWLPVDIDSSGRSISAATKEAEMSSSALQALFPEDGAEHPGASNANGTSAGAVRTDAAFVACLARMRPAHRIAASRNGGFTRHERAVWACRYPHEVPTINGEFEWLVLGSADLD